MVMRAHTFRDFDAFANSVRNIDSTMLLQNPRRRRWCISHVFLPGVHVQLGRLGSGNIVEGQSWSNGYLLYLPLTDACAYSANGTVLEKNAFMIVEPGCEFCISTKAEHDWCSIFVPADTFAGGGDLGEPLSGSDEMTCRVTCANRRIANQFQALVGQIMTAAATCPPFESSTAATYAAAELRKLAASVVGERLADEPNQQGRPGIPRAEIIRCCKKLLQERRGEHVHINELAAAAGVSERTLRTAFKEYFAVGPVRYLQLRQLHQIHRTLREADPEAVSVTEVLVQQGEWAFSRFARRYRQLFGELPSETLRTKSR
jgi:AraC family ethanolamine operon transcriptional activator